MKNKPASLFQKWEWLAGMRVWVLVVLIVVSVLFGLYAKGQIDQIVRLAKEWQMDKRIVRAKEDNYAAKQEMMEELLALEKRDTQMKMVSDSEVSAVIAYVESVWEQCGLTAEKLTMGKRELVSEEPVVYQIRSVLTGVGSYDDVILFLDTLNQGAYHLFLSEMIVSTDSGMQEGDVYLEVSFAFFCYGERDNQTEMELPEQTEIQNPFYYEVSPDE